MTTSVAVALIHATVSLFLVGTIWTVQVVHYPLFAAVGSASFVDYEAGHTARITRLLALPWGLQGLTTVALLVSPPAGVPVWLVWVAASVVAVPVAVTIVVSVPAHTALGAGFDAGHHRRLVRTNWLRTIAWTVHGALAVAILVAAFHAT